MRGVHEGYRWLSCLFVQLFVAKVVRYVWVGERCEENVVPLWKESGTELDIWMWIPGPGEAPC